MRGISISLHSAGGKFMSSLTRASITPSICPSAIPIREARTVKLYNNY